MNKKAVIILSGGMDSTTLLYDLKSKGYEVDALSFNYNQKHKKELKCAKRVCEELNVNHTILDLKLLNKIAPSALTRKDWKVPEGHYASKNMKQTVVPNRNMIMLSLATAYAIGIGAKEVYYGSHKGDHEIYPDCRKEFVESMQKSISLCDWTKVKLKAPYLKYDKGQIAKLGKKLNVNYSLTWTCYKGGKYACGKCGSCVERLEAFKFARIKDSIKYNKVKVL